MKIISPDLNLVNAKGQYEWSLARAIQAWDRALEDFQHTLEDFQHTLRPNAMLLVGIPGSGKTTFLEDQIKEQGSILREVSVVLDATLTSRMSRRPLIEIARMMGAGIEAVVFDVPLIVAMNRNAARPPERRVPQETLFRMAQRLEEEPPTLREGFWRITSAVR